MKKILAIIGSTLMVGLLSACGASEQAKELADYHNSYVETVNNLANQVDVELGNSYNVETPEETVELQREYVMPLVKEITDYIEAQDPQTDIVKELHNMRLTQLAAWSEALELHHEALQKTVEGASEDEINQLVADSDEKMTEAIKKAQEADERMVELAEEHGVELTKEEG
ncbi:hypothetical protein [Lentibacillus saliphilus]|uniref:hypothetical protein n=1 Tax=Lentibacillus saliphilus TaxID=2737028 RepID=UPI001C2FBDF1|nr:hypothetical protein [Lentibacillus saliphilus]